MKKRLLIVISVFIFTLLFIFVNSSEVFATSYSISSFSLYGQKTYGAANTWQTGLGYAGTTMHSVYRWEVWTSSISSGETGKYATVNFSGIIQLPDGWSYSTLDQGYTITQCVLGNQVATLSNIQTSWAPNVNSQNVPVITYAASASLEFPSNSVSGQFYCTFQSNNGQYFVQSDGSAVSQIIFGNTGVDLTFSNTLSDELLQQQVNQNNTIIGQNQEIINSQNETNDWLKDDTPAFADTSSLSGAAGWLPAGPVDSILTLPTQLLGGIVNAFTNPGSCSPLSLPLPWVDYNLKIPCLRSYLDMTGFTPIWDTIGGIIGAFIIWETLKWLYDFVDKTLSFREDNSSIWGGL